MLISKRKINGVYDIVLIIFLSLVGMLSLAPIINTAAISLSSSSAAAAGRVSFVPIEFTLSSYRELVGDVRFFRAFWISVKRVFLGGGLNLVLTILMAFPLSREVKVFRARNVYMWLIVFTMLFNGGLIPWYLTINRVGLIDTIWALVLPGAVPVFNVILLMNFFRGIPKEMEDAAVVDGAGLLCILMKIFLPVSLPALATITLFSVVHHWNSFFDGLILMNRPENYPLQTYIQQLIIVLDIQNIRDPERLRRLMQISNRTFNAAKIMVSMIPILLIYPFLQRYFISGIVLGSVKE